MRMLHAAKPTVCVCLVLLVLVAGVSCLPKAKPTSVLLPDGRAIEARQARVWVYELTNILAGQVELVADEIIETDEDPRARRAAASISRMSTVTSTSKRPVARNNRSSCGVVHSQSWLFLPDTTSTLSTPESTTTAAWAAD